MQIIMVAQEKRTPQQKIQSTIDDMDMFIRTCNAPKFAQQIDFLSMYLEDSHKKDIITSDTYLNNKANIKQRIRKFDENCECNIKNLPPPRISYVGPR